MKFHYVGPVLALAFAHAQIAAQPADVSLPVATEELRPVVPVAPVVPAVLRTGTEVPLKMSEELTTKKKAVRVGQRFHMAVSEDVKVNGRVVIPVGSPAMGEVTSVRNKGMWGKSGHLGAQVLYVEVNGRQIKLNGTFDDKGVTGTAGVVAAVVLVPVVGFFTTGTSAVLPLGAQVKSFVAEDVPLSFAEAATPTLPVAVVQPAALLSSAPASPAPAQAAAQ